MITLEGVLASGAPVRVRIESGTIAAVEPCPAAGGGPLLLPGLVDLQVNGYAGLDVNADDVSADTVIQLTRALWSHGATAYCPTLVTAPEEKIISALRAVARARATHPLIARSIVGVHVEGPYISSEDGPRGAHDARHVRPADPAELRRWQQACDGLVRIVTIAPEVPGALAYIRSATAAGVLVSLGHTAAEPKQIRAAADAGASLSTHLGNGCHGMLPRHHNHLWTQLADDRLTAGFIADGHHLPADAFTAMVRAKGLDRALLVSDSAALAGCAPGEYRTPVGGSVTVGPDGRLSLSGSATLLAGSGRSLTQCLAWLLRETPFTTADATRMTSITPARMLGLPGRGGIEAGAAAELTVLSTGEDGFAVQATVVGGEVVYQR